MFSFTDVIGQDAAKARLRQDTADQRVPHALLFTGPPGAGKLPLALAYARYLTCRQSTADDACGRCPSCAMWNKLGHPDVHFIFPIVNKAKSPKVSTCDDFFPQWRQALSRSAYMDLSTWLDCMEAENKQAQIFAQEADAILRKLSLKSSQGGYKVCIIWLPEKMNAACANKLLKLLEEPPELTVFLLVSEAPEQLLATITSRTQRFHIPAIAQTDMLATLTDRYGISPDEAANIVHMANGNLLKAMEAISTSQQNSQLFDLFVRLMRNCYQRKVGEMKKWSEEAAALGRERSKDLLAYLQRMTRESFIANLHNPELNYMNVGEQSFVARFAPFVNERNVADITAELAEAQAQVEQNVNARMIFFDLALRMTVLLRR